MAPAKTAGQALFERRRRLHAALETVRARSGASRDAVQDPIEFPRRFRDPRDIEIVGWLASALAYGRVNSFRAVLQRILTVLGNSPHRFVSRFDPRRDARLFFSLYYRMNRGEDIACLIYFMRSVAERCGSIGALFERGYREEDEDIGPALERFVRHVQAIDTTPVYGRRLKPYGLSQFLSLPSKGSACKRLNLFLRWMVRPDDGVDFGLWKGIPPSKLVIPLDTHIFRIGRYLGFTRRRSPGWKAAADITRALKRFDAEDPLRYDFALCHLGISGNCPVRKNPDKCRICPLLSSCARGRMLA